MEEKEIVKEEITENEQEMPTENVKTERKTVRRKEKNVHAVLKELADKLAEAADDEKPVPQPENAVADDEKPIPQPENAVEEREEPVHAEKKRVSESEEEQVKSDVTFNAFVKLYEEATGRVKKLELELETLKSKDGEAEMFARPDFVEKAASNAEVEKRVIEKYLKKVASGGTVEVLSSGHGASVQSILAAPKTLKEAKRYADAMLRG